MYLIWDLPITSDGWLDNKNRCRSTPCADIRCGRPRYTCRQWNRVRGKFSLGWWWPVCLCEICSHCYNRLLVLVSFAFDAPCQYLLFFPPVRSPICLSVVFSVSVDNPLCVCFVWVARNLSSHRPAAIPIVAVHWSLLHCQIRCAIIFYLGQL